MQGQRQQQVALQFGVNVSTIERLVRRLRDTGRVADRSRRGGLRVTTPRLHVLFAFYHFLYAT
jgi:transposase